jgi:D-serine dehydratase
MTGPSAPFSSDPVEISALNDKASATTASAGVVAAIDKGLGYCDHALDAGEIKRLDWNLLREDLSLPSAVLYQNRLLNNLDWMRRFIAAYGVKLAPHGKTTMAPKLFKMQLDAGAWGITLATAHQTLVAYTHGVRRVLMANQLVGKENMAIVARMLEDPSFDFYCLVDSAAQIDQLGAFYRERGQSLRVLLELGVKGGRAGVRTDEQLQSVLAALSRWPQSVALCGVEIYEGVLHDEGTIRQFLERAVTVTRELLAANRFQRTPALLSGAGSAWFDVVAEVFSSANFAGAVEIVLRPGCYLSHDVGAYREAQERMLQSNSVVQGIKPGLVPALQIWAYVQSLPEPEKAIVGMGKRDAAFDAGLPVPAAHFRPGTAAPHTAPAHWTLTKMMDQHAYLRIAAGDDLRVGDMIAFDILHPCLTFDKWRVLPVLDAEYNVVDIVETFF